MSDTVKVIIEIPKETYLEIKDGLITRNAMASAEVIQNGIPLDDVKAEMEDLAERYKEYRYATTYISLCIKILDNIGKAESEE